MTEEAPAVLPVDLSPFNEAIRSGIECEASQQGRFELQSL